MNELQGKAAIITGASQGIGRAISLVLSDKGASVVLAARSEGKLLTLRDEIIEKGGKALVVKTDVGMIEDCKCLVQQTLNAYNKIDILINSAGRGLGGGGPIEASDPEAVTKMVQVNLLGAYYCTFAVLPSMKAQSSGHIVNISSVAGIKYFPQSPMYSATKFAVRAFSEGLRNQVQKWNIRVTTVYPGQTDTPMLERVPLAERNKFLRPEHIARAIIHALEYPDGVSMNEIVIRPTWQEE